MLQDPPPYQPVLSILLAVFIVSPAKVHEHVWIFAEGYLRLKMGMVLACSQGMGPVTLTFPA